MYSLGIESTAHTIGCSVIKVNPKNLESDERCKILSDVRAVYKAPTGSGIHPPKPLDIIARKPHI